MFEKPTVFILGAGASWHYNYPTGEDLVKRVIEKTSIIMSCYENDMKRGMANPCEIISEIYYRTTGSSNPSHAHILKFLENFIDRS